MIVRLLILCFRRTGNFLIWNSTDFCRFSRCFSHLIVGEIFKSLISRNLELVSGLFFDLFKPFYSFTDLFPSSSCFLRSYWMLLFFFASAEDRNLMKVGIWGF